jgi:hypothetical protein
MRGKSRRDRIGSVLYSRWGLFAGSVCWGCLAGFVFLVWLAPVWLAR